MRTAQSVSDCSTAAPSVRSARAAAGGAWLRSLWHGGWLSSRLGGKGKRAIWRIPYDPVGFTNVKSRLTRASPLGSGRGAMDRQASCRHGCTASASRDMTTTVRGILAMLQYPLEGIAAGEECA